MEIRQCEQNSDRSCAEGLLLLLLVLLLAWLLIAKDGHELIFMSEMIRVCFRKNLA